jgi:hypothetical protein
MKRLYAKGTIIICQACGAEVERSGKNQKWCSACGSRQRRKTARESGRRWKLAHAEQEAERKRQWRMAHREQERERKRKWTAAHLEAERARKREYDRTVRAYNRRARPSPPAR